MIVGTAEVMVLANDKQFERSLREGAKPGLSGLEQDAKKTGDSAGEALAGGLSVGGRKGGEELDRGVKAGAGKAITDAEEGGRQGGGRFVSGMKTALGGLVGAAGAPFAAVGSLAEKADEKASGSFTRLAGIGKTATLGIGAAAVAISGYSVKAATDYQELTTRLVTGAGEAAGPNGIDKIRTGMLQMSAQVGTSATDLANGMFMIESAGFHAATGGLDVLKAAAEGAKTGGADLSVVANGLTTVLTDFHLPASQAAAVTSQLVETVASGKTTMQDLAGSLSTVLPVAAAAHIQFSDVAGAMATMTGQGISASEAAQNIANTIRNLQNVTPEAQKAMEQFGISATDVQTSLGQRGLSGTLDYLTGVITKQMGPSGLVLQDALKKSESASKDAKIELSKMPASLQDLAKQYLSGSITQKDWRASLKGLSVDQKEMAMQFAATVNQSRGFNDALKSGSPAAKTLAGTLSQMLGGATGLNTALALTGPNMVTYKTNIANIDSAGKAGAKTVQGFAETQKDFKFKLDAAKASVQVMGIQIGDKLIPILESAAKVVAGVVMWLLKHKDVAIALAGVIGGVLTLAIAAWIAKMTLAAARTVADFAKMIAAGAEWVAKMAVQLASQTAAFVEWAAQQAASVAETLALWAMYAAEWLAEQIPAMATFLAEHAAMAAGFVAENLVMIASATAAFIAENAATLGIVAAIAVLIGAIVYLATHWSQVWGEVKKIAGDVKDFVIGAFHSVVSFFEGPWGNAVLGAIALFMPFIGIPLLVIKNWGVISGFFASLWGSITGVFMGGVNAVTGFFSRMWNDLTGMESRGINAIVSFFEDLPSRILRGLGNIGGAIAGVFTGLPDQIYKGVIEPIVKFFEDLPGKVLNAIAGLGSQIVGAIEHSVPGGGIVGSAVSAIGGLFEKGGMVGGAKGAPMLAVVHGGEYVLSNDDLDALQQHGGTKNLNLATALAAFNPGTAATMSAGVGQAQAQGVSVDITRQVQSGPTLAEGAIQQTFLTPMNPSEVVDELGWELRKLGLVPR